MTNKSVLKGGNEWGVAESVNIMDGYEKIKTVGKGSFGTATLYKRLNDGLMVVMKEVYLTDMSQTERKLAMNEVEVLSSLNHENIIRYLGSFERDGSLVIVMEYANGGNLAQLISSKKEHSETFSETQILNLFSQICAGISYMHAHKILHRDMKSANLFLNKNGVIKIGDFGISKMMDTRSIAQTVVGTPYYLSPEMCEGIDYNEKSDIWAMGCILYELACLRKPFEASSLPALVQKITTCEYPPIPESYSDGLYQLIAIILQRNPDSRPSARNMYQTLIPSLLDDLDKQEFSRRYSIISFFSKSLQRERSVLYELCGFTSNPSLQPVQLPHNKIISFSNSTTHFMVVNADKRVYTWGEDAHGQLGHGHPENFKKYPIAIDYLRGKNITRCFAGDGYSIFLNKHGTIFSCGDGKNGCLGHGDWENTLRPKIIESLLNLTIVEVSCGSRHVVALASNGKVYVWGSAQDGQLGLGHTQFCCRPMPVHLPNEYNVEKIYAGFNCSALLTTAGKVLMCGSNKYNKLGFENEAYLKSYILFRGVNEKIVDISFGQTHTVMLTEGGEVLCLGSNEEKQCGNAKNGEIVKIEGLVGVEKISAGNTFTVVSTKDNVIYFWGTYFQDIETTDYYDGTGSGDSRSTLVPLPKHYYQAESSFKKTNKYAVTPEPETYFSIVESKPKPILALYASATNIKANNILWLADIKANHNSISILVHTTAPPPMKRQPEETNEVDEQDNQSKILDRNWKSQHTSRNVSLPNTPEIS